MNRRQDTRRLPLLGAAVAAALLGVITFAVHDAKARILHALGPRTSVGELSLSYPTVTLRDVRIAADPARGKWPAAEEFHAGLVRVSITAGSLWAYRRGAALVIEDVQVQDGTLVMLRTPGHLTTLPALRDTGTASATDAANTLVVQHVRVERLAVDLYDATLAGAARVPLRFEQVEGELGDIALPALDAPIAVDLRGRLRGPEHAGAVAIKGRVAPGAHDADLAFRLAGVDLVALQPYLTRFGERPVRSGLLDLALDAHVVDRQVNAPGRLTLTGLEFGKDENSAPFAGVERRAVLAALKKDGRIDLRFTLEGRTDDPKFTLDEKLGIRIAAVMGETVGLGAKGVVEGVGDVFKGLANGLKGGKPAR
jgi:hypothetical protein